MNLYRSYAAEPLLTPFSPIECPELDNTDQFANMLRENMSRFLGIPKEIQLPNESPER